MSNSTKSASVKATPEAPRHCHRFRGAGVAERESPSRSCNDRLARLSLQEGVDWQGSLGMSRFVEGEDHTQSTLLLEKLDDYLTDDNPVRVMFTSMSSISVGLALTRSLPKLRAPTITRQRSSRSTSTATPIASSRCRRLGARDSTQRRGDVARRAAEPRLQDPRRFPSGQRRCAPEGMQSVHRRDRQQQVQGGQ